MKRTHRASRLELLVAAVLIAIVAALLLERLTRYQEYTEKAVMEATIAHMRSGLRVRVAEMMITGSLAQLQEVRQENPVGWLEAPPANYLGEIPAAAAAAGNWYFDRDARELVYRPRHTRFFEPLENSAVAEVRLQVRPAGAGDSGGASEKGKRPLEGLRLVVANGYRWH
ncbi:MAG: hypothetical protein WBG17_02630 [Burkholderiaceae bacterium]